MYIDRTIVQYDTFNMHRLHSSTRSIDGSFAEKRRYETNLNCTCLELYLLSIWLSGGIVVTSGEHVYYHDQMSDRLNSLALFVCAVYNSINYLQSLNICRCMLTLTLTTRPNLIRPFLCYCLLAYSVTAVLREFRRWNVTTMFIGPVVGQGRAVDRPSSAGRRSARWACCRLG